MAPTNGTVPAKPRGSSPRHSKASLRASAKSNSSTKSKTERQEQLVHGGRVAGDQAKHGARALPPAGRPTARQNWRRDPAGVGRGPRSLSGGGYGSGERPGHRPPAVQPPEPVHRCAPPRRRCQACAGQGPIYGPEGGPARSAHREGWQVLAESTQAGRERRPWSTAKLWEKRRELSGEKKGEERVPCLPPRARAVRRQWIATSSISCIASGFRG